MKNVKWELEVNGERMGVDAKTIRNELDRLRSEHSGKIFTLISPTNNAMIVGLKDNIGILDFIPGDDKPPYYHSVREKHNETHEFELFFAGGEATEIPWNYCIDYVDIIIRVGEFMETDALPKSGIWEED